MRKLVILLMALGLALAACDVNLSAATLPPTLPPMVTNTPGVVATDVPTITSTPVPQIVTETPPPALPLINAPQLVRFKMIDLTHGWGLVDQAVADQVVVRTEDGGVTWLNVTPAGVTGKISYFVGSFFKDAFTAWVAIPDQTDPVNQGTLYATTDGGLSWTMHAIPFGYGDMQFLDANNGFVMMPLGAGAGSVAIAIFQTTDGGATWTRNFVNDPTVPGATNSIPLGGHKDGIIFTDTSHGWVGGDVPAPATIYLYASTDSGHTWTQQNLTLPSGHENNMTAMSAPVFFNANAAVLPVVLVDTTQLVLYSSHDGGATWSASTGLLDGGSIYHLNVLSSTDAIAFANGKFFATHDMGNTWSIVTPATDYTDTMAVMDFVDLQHGWLITSDSTGHRSLLTTTDGGATWNTLIP